MTNFERVAIFTLIENVENQLKGLKVLLAASAAPGVGGGSTSSHKVHGQPQETNEMTVDEENALESALKAARERENKAMANAAEREFGDQWREVQAEMGTRELNG